MNHETEEITYKRSAQDQWVNGYNWHNLALSQSSMDIQLNLGSRMLSNISKYIAKSDDLLKATIQGDNTGHGQGKGIKERCRKLIKSNSESLLCVV